MSRTLDVIVTGAGSMGMRTGYHLAKQGLGTLLIDAFDPPHSEWSHHGEPCLIRHAYCGGPAYITMALRAHKLWNELEELAETELLVQSGVLNAANTQLFSFRDRIGDSQKLGVPVELLDAAEIGKRWPGLRLPDHFEGMYEPEAGYLYSEKCVAAYRRLALAEGAELLVNTPVEQMSADDGGVTVRTRSGDKYHAAHVILSAGAWFRTLEPFIRLPIRSVRKVVGWFESKAESPLFDAGRFPGFTLGGSEGGYYGFPSIGGAGLKILDAYMPQSAGRLLRGAVCKYEFSPDDNFIIDRHPEHSNVLLAGGFSGHGFKFSSVVGEILSDLVVKGRTDQDLSLFAVSRFASEAEEASDPALK